LYVMKKVQRINRSMVALGFLGAYSLAALLLLVMLKEVAADRYTGSGVTHRNGDMAGGSNDFTIAALSDFEKYPGRLGPDKSNAGAPDDATSAIGDVPPGGGFFADNGLSGSPGDLQQASFVTGADAPGRGRANFAPPLTSGGLPDGVFGGGGGAPFGGPTFIPFSPGGTGTEPGPSPTVSPPTVDPPVVVTPVVDTPLPNPPSGPPTGPPSGPPGDPPPDPLPPGPSPSVPGPPDPGPGDPGPPPPPGSPNPPGPALPVPEPMTLSIFAAGLAGVAALRRGRKKPA
jgi:hypothetical protein